MDHTPDFNPYEPPLEKEPEFEVETPINYWSITKRWRPLRFRYNLILLIVGLFVSIPFFREAGPIIIFPIFFYAAFANLFFTLGVIPELFIAFTTRNDDLPQLRKFAFTVGLLFSIILTLFLVFAASTGGI